MIIYMDDSVTATKDERCGLSELRSVLKMSGYVELNLKWKKYQCLKNIVNYLGHIIEVGKVSPREEKADAVKPFPKQTDVREVKSFFRLKGSF